MPSSTATLVYSVPAVGAPDDEIEAALVSVPLPLAVLSFLGVTVTSDVTTGRSRTVAVGLAPSGAGALFVQLGIGDNTSSVVNVSIIDPGEGFAVPPQVVIDPPPGGGTIGSGGITATATATLDVKLVIPVALGALYSAPVVTLVGGLNPVSGVAAVVTANIGLGGTLESFNVVSPGANYVSVPTVVITDPTGSGATAEAILQMATITVRNGGFGYVTVPSATPVSTFKALYPDGSDQAAPFVNLMTSPLSAAVASPVVAAAPVIS
jgi:hypothetical protein